MSRRKRKPFSITCEQLAAFEAADPNLAFKPLTEETAEDFKRVVRARFAPGVERQVDTLLTNPLREYCASVGDIAYEMGEPACVQGAMLRRLYVRQTPYLMLNGSMFAKIPKASPISVFGIMRRTDTARGGLLFSFANTMVTASSEIGSALKLGIKGVPGPRSWLVQRFVPIHFISCFWTRFRSIHPRLPAFHWKDFSLSQEDYRRSLGGGLSIQRYGEIDDTSFGSFWQSYLSGNDGLLTSRSPEDLRWMYQLRIKSGEVVVLGLTHDGLLKGYIVFRKDDRQGKCWSVLDMIALNNDSVYLRALMRESVRFLKRCTPAMELTISGFPQWIQPTIARIFWCKKKRFHNPSSFSVYDAAMEDLLNLVDSNVGWFGGPADGDFWL